jgi:hypothetical protein
MVTRKFETFRQSSSSTRQSRNWKTSRSVSAILLQLKPCITRESDPGSYTNDVRWVSLAWIYAIMSDEPGILSPALYTWTVPMILQHANFLPWCTFCNHHLKWPLLLSLLQKLPQSDWPTKCQNYFTAQTLSKPSQKISPWTAMIVTPLFFSLQRPRCGHERFLFSMRVPTWIWF